MAATGNESYVYVGLACESENVGAGGLYRRAERDQQWQDIGVGLPQNPQVRALLIHPENPAVVYAGTQLGPYRSDDRGEHWEALESPSMGADVWSLAFHPHDPSIIFAGYDPFAIRRSEDGGESWSSMDTEKVVFPHITTYMPPTGNRAIEIAADPTNPMDVYCAIEVGGLLASRDGGGSWESITDGPHLRNNTLDLHGVQISRAAPGTVFIVTQVAMFRSRDRGHHWEHVQIEEMFPGGSYCRDLLVAPDDPRTLYMAAGAGGGGAPPGTVEEGALFRSRDLGESWDRVNLGGNPPGRMFDIAVDAAKPSHIYCCARGGELHSSYDGGTTWSKDQVPAEMSGRRHVYPMVCG